MAEDLMFDDREDDVLEIVLASDEEYQGSVEGFGDEEFRVRRKGIVSRFVPGVEAGAVLALGLSFVGLVSSALIDQYVQDRAIAGEFNQALAQTQNTAVRI